METVSPDLGISYAEKLGIHTLTENDHYASAALGGLTDGVSCLLYTSLVHGNFLISFWKKVIL